MAVTQEMIDKLDLAILKIATGAQSFSLGDGTSVTRANLKEVQALRDKWQSELSATQGRGGFVPIGFSRPMAAENGTNPSTQDRKQACGIPRIT